MVSDKTVALEDHAAKIVAVFSGLNATRLDRGGTQRPDFQLSDADGAVVGVLEVTSAKPQRRAEMESILEREQSRLLRNCAQFWVISLVHDGVVIKNLWKLLELHLVGIERDHPRGMFAQIMAPSDLPYFPNGVAADANKALHQAGVSFIRSALAPDGKQGWVLLLGPGVGGAIGPTMVTDAVNTELAKPDNRRKLEMSDGRAELFVWLDGTDAQLAMTTPLTAPYPHGQPVDGPTLPDGVTAAWAAFLPDDVRGALAIWHSTGGTWSIRTITDPHFASRNLLTS